MVRKPKGLAQITNYASGAMNTDKVDTLKTADKKYRLCKIYTQINGRILKKIAMNV